MTEQLHFRFGEGLNAPRLFSAFQSRLMGSGAPLERADFFVTLDAQPLLELTHHWVESAAFDVVLELNSPRLLERRLQEASSRRDINAKLNTLGTVFAAGFRIVGWRIDFFMQRALAGVLRSVLPEPHQEIWLELEAEAIDEFGLAYDIVCSDSVLGHWPEHDDFFPALLMELRAHRLLWDELVNQLRPALPHTTP